MAPRNLKGAAPAIDKRVLEQMAESLEVVKKGEERVYRGNERHPILSVSAPAHGVFSAHGVDLIKECAVKRKLESQVPQALRVLKSAVPGYMILEPLDHFDPTQPDQFQLLWYRGNQQATIELLEAFQPRNLEVPAGYVSEMPLSLEDLPRRGCFLILHTGDAVVRAEEKEAPGAKSSSNP